MRILTSLERDEVIAVDISNNIIAKADNIKDLFNKIKKLELAGKKPLPTIKRQSVCKGSFSMGNWSKYRRDQVNLSNGLRKRDF